MKKAIILLVVLLLGTASFAMGVGVETNLFGITTPFLRIGLNPNQSIDVGAYYNSINDSAFTDLQLWGRFNSVIAKMGKVTTSWAGVLGLRSDKGLSNFGADTTTIALRGLLGAEYDIVENVTIYGNVNLLTLNSASSGGASATTFTLLTGNALIYTGIVVSL